MEYILLEVALTDGSFQFYQQKFQWNVEEVEGHEELQNPTNNKTSSCNNTSRNQPKCNQSIYDYMRFIVICD